jgi:excinuclease ABC subunit A
VSQIAFEGIVPRLNRLFRETTSTRMREEVESFMNEQSCPSCHGARLKPEALAVSIGPWSIVDLTRLAIEQLINELEHLEFDQRQVKLIARPILKEIRERLFFLQGVGLGYLSLDRKAGTLSGGEAQRIRLASQIGSGLAGVLYILDEPSIGLHQRDNNKLIKTLVNLRDLGNTVIVVEHDADTIASADHVLDIGPGAGPWWRDPLFRSGSRPARLREFAHRRLSFRPPQNRTPSSDAHPPRRLPWPRGPGRHASTTCSTFRSAFPWA